MIIGFPLLTALALRYVTAAHSIVFIGLLPLATAIFGVLRGGERPRIAFWIFSLLGSLLVAGFALWQSATLSLTGDVLMLAAVLACGLGYAEGATLTRELGGWQVIGWALVISLPAMLLAAFITRPPVLDAFSLSTWTAVGYVSLFSMLIGFIFWYKGWRRAGSPPWGNYSYYSHF